MSLTFGDLDEKLVSFAFYVRFGLYPEAGRSPWMPKTTVKAVEEYRRARKNTLQELAGTIQDALSEAIKTSPPALLNPALELADRASQWVVEAHSRLYDYPIGPEESLEKNLAEMIVWSRVWWRQMATIVASAERMEIAALVSAHKRPSSAKESANVEKRVAEYIRERLSGGRERRSITRDGIAHALNIAAGKVSETTAWRVHRNIKRDELVALADEGPDWTAILKEQEREMNSTPRVRKRH